MVPCTDGEGLAPGAALIVGSPGILVHAKAVINYHPAHPMIPSICNTAINNPQSMRPRCAHGIGARSTTLNPNQPADYSN